LIGSDPEKIGTQDRGESPGDRRVLFWILSIVVTLLYLFLVSAMLTVPGILPVSKLWMLSVASGCAGTALLVGIWRAGATDAPMANSRSALVVGMIVLLELLHCAVGAIAIASTQLR
jgi:hypothetical protein